ncbi:PREDICTED: protein FAM227B [Chrysochloris asiatica]|uniref:Protein FAM227B n=1 Tax=Chrysochloris asiatica TaxID=185453 RepID=A0A9B0SXW9_CHRAS|nr:PREDICTED: protein FAM227B [Chrysochloris asiatica]
MADGQDYWPREVHLGSDPKWTNTLKNIKEDCSFISIYTHLWENVPRLFEAVSAMESGLEKCSLLLKDHASKLFEWDTTICNTVSYGGLEKHKKFLMKYYKKKKIMLSDDMETKKNIEGCDFSGFKASELTQLPRHLDAEQIYLYILKAHNFDDKIFNIWRTHFLSEASIALLHDSFWWWFLYKFKPDRENQDSLFDRISESFVALFMSVPLNRKDAFLQIYPDCLAQAIYATFQEAFPESSNLFNDEFKEDLGNNIFLWLSGLKPQKGFWTHWKLKGLTTTTIHGSKKAPEKSLNDMIASSQERIMATINFDITKILKNPKTYVMATSKKESSLLKPAMKSHYISTGPEFKRVLFNFGSQSPLILNYLKMHELAGIPKTSVQTKIKLTEIFQEPSPAPTYRDIIKEAKKQFSKNRKDFRILQAKPIKKPFEIKHDFEKFLNKLVCLLSEKQLRCLSLAFSFIDNP